MTDLLALLCLALIAITLIAAHWADQCARAGVHYEDAPHSRDISKK